MTTPARIFGRGLAFPPRLAADARIAWSEGPDNIRESIRVILMTEPGERVMLPNFGAGLQRYLFEPNIVTTHRRIEEAILQSLERWEPRIRVSAVDVAPHRDDLQAAVATIQYALVANSVSDQVQLRLQLGG